MRLEELFQIIISTKNKVEEIDFSDMLYSDMNDATKCQIYDTISRSIERENELLEGLGIKLVPDVKFDIQNGKASCRICVIKDCLKI